MWGTINLYLLSPEKLIELLVASRNNKTGGKGLSAWVKANGSILCSVAHMVSGWGALGRPILG